MPARQLVIAVPPRRDNPQQATIKQSCKVCARGLRRHARAMGQLACCQRFAAQQRRKHGRPCRIADQGSSVGKVWIYWHTSILLELLSCYNPTNRRFDHHIGLMQARDFLPL